MEGKQPPAEKKPDIGNVELTPEEKYNRNIQGNRNHQGPKAGELYW